MHSHSEGKLPSNVFQLSAGPRCRVLIAHQSASTRREIRSLIETEGMAVIEVADGEAALAELEMRRFDLLMLEMDLPEYDGLTVMKLHGLLRADERTRPDPPAILFTLPREVRCNATLAEQLRTLGVDGLIDDFPGEEVAGLVAFILNARARRTAVGRPSAARARTGRS